MIMMSVKSFSYSKPLALEEYSTHRIAFMVLFLFDSLIGVVTINYYMQENYSNSAFKFHRKKKKTYVCSINLHQVYLSQTKLQTKPVAVTLKDHKFNSGFLIELIIFPCSMHISSERHLI